MFLCGLLSVTWPNKKESIIRLFQSVSPLHSFLFFYLFVIHMPVSKKLSKGHAVAPMARCWLFTVETWVHSQVASSEIHYGGWNGTGAFFFLVLWLSLLIIIPPLVYTHLPLFHEVCDSPDQAAHYTVSPKLGTSSLTWQLAGLRVKGRFYMLCKIVENSGRIIVFLRSYYSLPHLILLFYRQ
jgi:hypothetical protein